MSSMIHSYCCPSARVFATACVLVTLTLVASNVHAAAEQEEQPTLSGKWSATAMTSRWNIGDWGKACGPRPGGAAAGANVIAIVQRGSELRITDAGRVYSTTQCWEQYPGLSPVSHRGGARGWRTVCKTAADDPRQATVVTTLTATDREITFDETGQYQFVIRTQNCTASVRRTRYFKLIQREGESPPPKRLASSRAGEPKKTEKVAPGPLSKSRTAREDRCADPGPPVRLEVRPSRKLMRPGERFSFRAVVLDRNRCPVPGVIPRWAVLDPDAPARLVGPGRLLVNEDAPETEVPLSASVGERAVRVIVEIASHERYEALLQQKGFNASGESGQAAVTAIASGTIGTRSAVGEDERRTWKLVLGGLMAFLVLVGGAVAWLLVRRHRRQQEVAALASATQEAPPRARVAEQRASAPSAPPGPRAMICPVCGTQFDSNAEFCGLDGAVLVPEN